MTRYALTLEYDGARYMGLQRQAHGPSVQQHVEDAIASMTGETATLFAAGRTDAGVHALAMRAHVDIDKPLTPYRLMQGVNAIMRPEPIAVTACEIVADDWHARFSCIGRRYLYRICNRQTRLALQAGRVWRVVTPLNVAAMHDAAQVLVGQHDFTTFRSVKCQAKSPLKTLERLDVRAAETLYGPEIHVHAAAPSFLHHQVRSMVGCLALVGQGKWNADDLRAALLARDRLALGFNAPPDGLYFVEAVYPHRVAPARAGASSCD